MQAQMKIKKTKKMQKRTLSVLIAALGASTATMATAAPINHSLNFENSPLAQKIVVDDKSYNGYTDAVFRDGLGREATFRGWNVSGAVKLKSMGFKPFKNKRDADISFGSMGQKMGANIVRFTVAWEGIHPAPDIIDYQYLDDVISYMKSAIARNMYIVIDYHSDLYTRYTFTKDSKQTGNGAPEWIVKGGNHGTENCGLPCEFTWGAHKLFDPATRSAYRAFWTNKPIETIKGKRFVQTEFLWQLGKTAAYIKQKLTPKEYDYILGFEPLNEPFDSGLEEMGLKNQSEFDNKILWPFYERVKAAMDANGMTDKLVFAEPNVFWYTSTGIVAPATGYGYLKYAPGKRFVFTPHMYDQGRMGVNDVTRAKNAAYFHKQDEVRSEARRLRTPMFLSEYGMWNHGKGKEDTLRIINATIQALETSENTRQKDRYADFYTPFVNGTQWHWNHYYEKGRELVNDNPNQVVTRFDAWNNENFSVVKEWSSQHMWGANITERSYPRRMQGDLMHFAYNAKVADKAGIPLNWHSIRVNLAGQFENREYFRDRKFAMVVWRGRRSEAPTEIYVPRAFKPDNVTVITEKRIADALPLSVQPDNIANEILFVADRNQLSNAGHRVLVWDDKDVGEDDNSMHYALIVEHTNDMKKADLTELQQALNQRIVQEKQSAVYLPSKMTFSGYAKDAGARDAFQLIEQRHQLCLDIPAAVVRNGARLQTFTCNGTAAQRWTYDKQTGQIRSGLNAKYCVTVAQLKSGARATLNRCQADNERQAFVKHPNWGWTLKAKPSLRLDSFAGWAGDVGVWHSNMGKHQLWKVRY